MKKKIINFNFVVNNRFSFSDMKRNSKECGEALINIKFSFHLIVVVVAHFIKSHSVSIILFFCSNKFFLSLFHLLNKLKVPFEVSGDV